MKMHWRVVYGEKRQYYNHFKTWGEAREYAEGLIFSGFPKSEVEILPLG